jgi:hypothetical protein
VYGDRRVHEVNANQKLPADIVGYTLVSREGQEVGPINSVWPDTHGNPEFLGVHVGPVAGTHLVPLRVARIDPDGHIVHVDVMKDRIENTRRFSPGASLTAQDRWETYHDWGLESPEPGAPTPYHADQQPMTTSADAEDMETPANPV